MIDELLNESVNEAKIGIENNEGGPFGAIITNKDGYIISKGHNKVLSTNDPTNHAEIVAIREACKKLNTHDLSGCIIYSSCEPCPMCLSAIIWSNIKVIYCGATRYDAEKIGFRDKKIYDFLNNENNILKKEYKENKKCKEIFTEYKGEIY